MDVSSRITVKVDTLKITQLGKCRRNFSPKQDAKRSMIRLPAQQLQGNSAHNDSPWVSVCLKDVVTILEDAVANRRTFLEDFRDERIQLSQDLFEVLVAYRRFHQENRAA